MYAAVNAIFLLLIILLVLQFWLWPKHRTRRSIILFAVLGIPFTVLRLIPELADATMGYWVWGFVFRPWTLLLCVSLMLIIAAGIRQRIRLLIYNSLVGTMVGFLALTRLQGFATDHDLLSGTVDAHGVCLQTSGYSCGPAAMAMALHLYGIDKTEREIAQACHSSLLNGTNEFLTYAYLRHHLSERGVTTDLLWEAQDRPRAPYIEEVRLNAVVNHWVLVVSETEDSYIVHDPLHGRSTIRRNLHEERSEQTFITFKRAENAMP